jgi:hypothetical protein
MLFTVNAPSPVVLLFFSYNVKGQKIPLAPSPKFVLCAGLKNRTATMDELRNTPRMKPNRFLDELEHSDETHFLVLYCWMGLPTVRLTPVVFRYPG